VEAKGADRAMNRIRHDSSSQIPVKYRCPVLTRGYENMVRKFCVSVKDRYAINHKTVVTKIQDLFQVKYFTS
jgi:hypothetical protein